MLRKLVSKEDKNRDRLLPYLLFAYREVPQSSSTGFSPFELLYGRKVRGPLDVLREEWEAVVRVPMLMLSPGVRTREGGRGVIDHARINRPASRSGQNQ